MSAATGSASNRSAWQQVLRLLGANSRHSARGAVDGDGCQGAAPALSGIAAEPVACSLIWLGPGHGCGPDVPHRIMHMSKAPSPGRATRTVHPYWPIAL